MADFVSKMLFRSQESTLDGTKEERKAFRIIKIMSCADPFLRISRLTKEAATTDAQERTKSGVLSRGKQPVVFDSSHRKTVTNRTKPIQYWAERKNNCLCRHKIETVPAWKAVHSKTNRKHVNVLFLPDDKILKTASAARTTKWAIALMGFKFDPCKCFKQTPFFYEDKSEQTFLATK